MQGMSAAVRVQPSLYMCAHTILVQSYIGIPDAAPRKLPCSRSELDAIPIKLYRSFMKGVFNGPSPRPRELYYILMRRGFDRRDAAPRPARKYPGGAVFSLCEFLQGLELCFEFWNCISKVWRMVVNSRSVFCNSSIPK